MLKCECLSEQFSMEANFSSCDPDYLVVCGPDHGMCHPEDACAPDYGDDGCLPDCGPNE